MIDSSDIFGAVLVVAILLIVLSVPSIFLTVRGSMKLLKKYKAFRYTPPEALEGIDVPKSIMDELVAMSSPLNYISMLSDEMERLGSVRPALMQAEIAMLLIIIMAVIPRFETDVLVLMAAVIVVAVIGILFWYRNFRDYSDEYYIVMRELEASGNDSEIRIYG